VDDKTVLGVGKKKGGMTVVRASQERRRIINPEIARIAYVVFVRLP